MLWTLAIAIICIGVALWSLHTARKALDSVRVAETSKSVECGRTTQQLDAERQTVAALRSEYDALLERCGVGVLLVDERGAIERANRAARNLLAVPSHELDGKRLLQATLSEEMDSFFRTARDARVPMEREMRATGGPGSALIVNVSPIVDSNGGAMRFLFVVRDVTELRRLETVRRDFVANVSHELRTLLTSIRAMAETL